MSSTNGPLLPRISRRVVLRGAGVALGLPWLESLARPARAAAVTPPKRFIAIFMPNGAPELWKPQLAGSGANWSLSSVLEPIGALKSKLSVLSGLETGSVFNANGSSSVELDGRRAGAWLTCRNSYKVAQSLMVQTANGISVDQLLASHPSFAGKTALPSLQVGLSTVASYCDNSPCALSRSVSWQTETTPLYKTVDPTQLFEKLVGAGSPEGSAAAQARMEARKSVLDAVLESATATRARASASDKLRVDEFLDSVRTVEKNVLAAGEGVVCSDPPTKPTFVDVSSAEFRKDTATYKKAVHADLINELLALALQCDQTRIASYMLEDERSEYIYDFIPVRKFTAAGSTPGTGFCSEWHGGGMHGSQEVLASIVHWHVGKVAALCQRLAGMLEENGSSVLDNSVVLFGAAVHGANHAAADLPTLLVGGGGGSLKTDQHLALPNVPLRNLHYTLMNGVYGLGVTEYGTNETGAPLATLSQLLT